MRRLVFIVLAGLSLAWQAHASEVIISGDAPDYAGETITFYYHPDPVLYQDVPLTSTSIGSTGKFSLSFPTSETCQVYCNLGKYQGVLVVEPGQEYHVILPKHVSLTPVQKSSPYFKPTPYWLGLKNRPQNDINFRLREFVEELTREINQNINDIYHNGSKRVVGEIIAKLENAFPDTKSSWFNVTKKYYYAGLEYDVSQRNPDAVVMNYFATQPVEMGNAKYQELFRTIFTNFLKKKAQSVDTEGVTPLVDSGNWKGLVSFFTGKGYHTSFAELAILKGLNDGFYSSFFDKKGVLLALKHAETEATSAGYRKLAKGITKHLTQTMTGSIAPAFNLKNNSGEETALSSFHGRYVYLNFFNTQNHECLQDLKLLKNVQQRYQQVLTIVSLYMGDDFKSAQQLWKQNSYSWPLLDASRDQKLADVYRVKDVPTYYLIGPDGKLLLSPAPAVSRGFQAAFVRVFRNTENQRKREAADSSRK
jgi:peroxiredoxin